MSWIARVLIVGAAVYGWQHQDELKSLWRKHQGNIPGWPTSTTKEEVLFFSARACNQPCPQAGKFLDEHGVKYRAIYVDDSQDNQSLWESYSSNHRLPVLVLNGEVYTGFARIDWLGAIAGAYGTNSLSERERRYTASHFNADGTPRLVLYGTNWCPYCRKLREWLGDKGINYRDVDVEAQPDQKELCQTLEIGGYPTVYYGYKRLEGGTEDIERQIRHIF